VFISSQITASSVLLMMQPCALSPSYMTIGFDTSFCTADMALIMNSMCGFSPGKLTTGHTITDARVLMVLALVHTGSGLSVCLHNGHERYRYQKGN